MQNYIPCGIAEITATLKNMKVLGWGFPLHPNLTYLFRVCKERWVLKEDSGLAYIRPGGVFHYSCCSRCDLFTVL